jgi:hypothetical protein
MRTIENLAETCITTGFFPGCLLGTAEELQNLINSGKQLKAPAGMGWTNGFQNKYYGPVNNTNNTAGNFYINVDGKRLYSNPIRPLIITNNGNNNYTGGSYFDNNPYGITGVVPAVIPDLQSPFFLSNYSNEMESLVGLVMDCKGNFPVQTPLFAELAIDSGALVFDYLDGNISSARLKAEWPIKAFTTATSAVAGFIAGSVVPGVGNIVGGVLGGVTGYALNEQFDNSAYVQNKIEQFTKYYERMESVRPVRPTTVTGVYGSRRTPVPTYQIRPYRNRRNMWLPPRG